MNNERTVLKLSVRAEYAVLQTYSRRHGLSSQFYIAMGCFSDLEQFGIVAAMDEPYFLKLSVPSAGGGKQTLRMYFTWLSTYGDDTVKGRREILEMDYGRFKENLEKSRAEEGAWQELLSLKETRSPHFCFHSARNLAAVVKNRVLRKKLGRFLMKNFRWKDAVRIHISDDFLPYSFFFTEETARGTGLCGGIILHGQDNLRTAHYAIHT